MTYEKFENPAKTLRDALSDGALTGPPEALEAVKCLSDLCINLGSNLQEGADRARDLLENAPDLCNMSEDDRTTAYVNLIAWSLEHDGDSDEVSAYNYSHGADCSGHPMRIMGYWPAVDDE